MNRKNIRQNDLFVIFERKLMKLQTNFLQKTRLKTLTFSYYRDEKGDISYKKYVIFENRYYFLNLLTYFT